MIENQTNFIKMNKTPSLAIINKKYNINNIAFGGSFQSKDTFVKSADSIQVAKVKRLTNLSHEANLVSSAALQAGFFVKNLRNKPDLHKEYKSEDNSIVTEADTQSEKLITKVLNDKKYAVYGEEGTRRDDSLKKIRGEYKVDPIDGTISYATGKPWYGVSIGRKSGASVVFLPETGELFLADKKKSYYGQVDTSKPPKDFSNIELKTLKPELVQSDDSIIMELGPFYNDDDLKIKQAFANIFLDIAKDKKVQGQLTFEDSAVSALMHVAVQQPVIDGKMSGFDAPKPFYVHNNKVQVGQITGNYGKNELVSSVEKMKNGKIVALAQSCLKCWDVAAAKEIMGNVEVNYAEFQEPNLKKGLEPRLAFFASKDRDIFDKLVDLYKNMVPDAKLMCINRLR